MRLIPVNFSDVTNGSLVKFIDLDDRDVLTVDDEGRLIVRGYVDQQAEDFESVSLGPVDGPEAEDAVPGPLKPLLKTLRANWADRQGDPNDAGRAEFDSTRGTW